MTVPQKTPKKWEIAFAIAMLALVFGTPLWIQKICTDGGGSQKFRILSCGEDFPE